ncbi:MAG: prolyl oligopeptidase family serine peptidase [bacterium]|nr:prolyl oligopeptidase family serine peptidase [bacterium]
MKKEQIFLFVFLFIVRAGLSAETIFPEEWKVLGPMHASLKDFSLPVEFHADFNDYRQKKFNYRFFNQELLEFSEFSFQNKIISLSSDTLKMKSAWDAMGLSGILTSYYCFSSFHSKKEKVLLAEVGGVSGFYINSVKYPGDPYKTGKIKIPVLVKEGENSISFITSGYYGYFEGYTKIYEPENIIVFLQNATLVFDIIKDSLMKGVVSVCLLNSTAEWQRVKVFSSERDSLFAVEERTDILPPMGVKNIPLSISMKEKSIGEEEFAEILIESGTDTLRTNLNFKVKNLNEVRKETFVSEVDSSVQYYAVRLPEDFSTSLFYPLSVSLHGAGVKAENQAMAYRSSKTHILVCPTNRGEFGFDWQDLGRIDFLEVLKKIKEKYRIIDSEISLTGHSMGGHGAMYLGSLYGWMFSSVVPASGWINFETYIPKTYSRINLLSNGKAFGIVNLLKSSENPLNFLNNLMNAKILLVHGEIDDNVPVYQSRMFFNELQRIGIESEFIEFAGMGHWFDIEETSGVDCIDSDFIRNFIEKSKRQVLNRISSFTTYSLYESDSSDFVRIDRQVHKYEKSSITAELKANEIIITTQNVEGFTILNAKGAYSGKIKFVIDGKEFLADGAKNQSFALKNKDFVRVKSSLKREDYTLVKYAFMKPFAIVYSTDKKNSNVSYEQALYIHNLFTVKCLGACEILPDTLFDSTQKKNIVFIGVPDKNSSAMKIFKKTLIQIDDFCIKDGEKFFETGNSSYIFCKKVDEYLCAGFLGQNKESQGRSTAILPLSSGVYLPEYALFGEDVESEGYNAIKECGFY